jgi:hypothetical protein
MGARSSTTRASHPVALHSGVTYPTYKYGAQSLFYEPGRTVRLTGEALAQARTLGKAPVAILDKVTSTSATVFLLQLTDKGLIYDPQRADSQATYAIANNLVPLLFDYELDIEALVQNVDEEFQQQSCNAIDVATPELCDMCPGANVLHAQTVIERMRQHLEIPTDDRARVVRFTCAKNNDATTTTASSAVKKNNTDILRLLQQSKSAIVINQAVHSTRSCNDVYVRVDRQTGYHLVSVPSDGLLRNMFLEALGYKDRALKRALLFVLPTDQSQYIAFRNHFILRRVECQAVDTFYLSVMIGRLANKGFESEQIVVDRK